MLGPAQIEQGIGHYGVGNHGVGNLGQQPVQLVKGLAGLVHAVQLASQAGRQMHGSGVGNQCHTEHLASQAEN